MIIYLRHSHDEYDDATHRHDHQITTMGKEKARQIGKKLIVKYGLPNIVYCSPFKRTRQTLKYMLKDHEHNTIKVKYDPNLSRYFNKNEQEDPSVFNDTDKFDIPVQENKRQFKERVNNHIKEITEVAEKDIIIWCITHTLVLKKVAKHHGITIPKHLEFMQSFILSSVPSVPSVKTSKGVSLVEKNKISSEPLCPRCGKIHK